jgi:hypothetical protein
LETQIIYCACGFAPARGFVNCVLQLFCHRGVVSGSNFQPLRRYPSSGLVGLLPAPT